jgi:Ser/Thr protein kinase RdoA (MazF antagonist)
MDIDSITPQDMRFNPPSFETTGIAPIIAADYGLQGRWHSLPGERDQNFHLHCEQGQDYVVKIAGQDEAPDITDFQVKALLHLEQGSPQLPVPRIVHTRSGACLSEISNATGVRNAIRVVTFLPGIPYGEGAFPDAEHLQKIGNFMGQIVNALTGFEHKAAKLFMPWNLSNGIAVSRDLWADAADDVKTLAAPMLDRLRNQVLPSLNACPSQVIHNDGHPYNLLRADTVAQEVTGLIDFGDMVYAPVINELAVTATTFQRRTMENLHTTEHLLAGFHGVHPLTDEEVSLLWDAITLRLLITVLLSDVKLKIAAQPNPDYFQDRTEALEMLAKACELDHTATVNTFRAVCGYC